jgi:exonuclease III
MRAMLARCERRQPDVIVLSEFRDTATGAAFRRELERLGFSHQAATEGRKGNGVLIAATQPFASLPNPFALGEGEYPNAILQANFGAALTLYGVYLPGQDRKVPHLRCLIAAAQACNERACRALCIGDFNSGRNATDIQANLGRETFVDAFSTAELYAELERYWTEAWAYLHPDAREFTWYPFRSDPDFRSRSGWRIDKAFVSPALLPDLVEAEYDHQFRLDRLTDHSGILVALR